ncbi:MAG: SPOR domain-containing protein [Nitrospirae bacterium]|nr:SPOR domain-containing protein [Nitrospirota bacterium]
MSIKALIGARAFAIVVVAVISGASFTLGFLVGKGVKNPVEVKEELQTPADESLKVPADGEEVTDFKEFETPLQEELQAPINSATLVEPKTVSEKTYCVQVGAFKNKKDAEILKNDLAKKGYKVYVVTSEDKTVHKVRTECLKSKKEAEVMALRLKAAEKIPTFVVEK